MFGIVLSMLIHAFLMYVFRNVVPANINRPETPPSSALEVRLLTLPPVLSAPPAREESKPVAKRLPKRLQSAQSITDNLQSKPVPAMSPPAFVAPAELPPAPQNRHHAAGEKSLNISELRKSVGKIVKDIDHERDALPVGQLRTKPLYAPDSETPLAREIAKTGRADCAAPNGLPGGLLAPVFLLMEKKGTGCKW